MTGKSAILLTGSPHVGKSTAIQRIIEQLSCPLGGFYTRELQQRGTRVGFEIITLDGKTDTLARKSNHRLFPREAQLGDYRINLDAVDSVAVPALEEAVASHSLVIVDEIAPMEIFSSRFCAVVWKIVCNPAVLTLGTIVERPIPFADDIKALERVHLEYVTPENRDSIPQTIISKVKKLQKDC